MTPVNDIYPLVALLELEVKFNALLLPHGKEVVIILALFTLLDDVYSNIKLTNPQLSSNEKSDFIVTYQRISSTSTPTNTLIDFPTQDTRKTFVHTHTFAVVIFLSQLLKVNG